MLERSQVVAAVNWPEEEARLSCLWALPTPAPLPAGGASTHPAARDESVLFVGVIGLELLLLIGGGSAEHCRKRTQFRDLCANYNAANTCALHSLAYVCREPNEPQDADPQSADEPEK